MKKTFITMCLTALAMSATADDTQLTVNLATNASPQTFTLTDIGKITFSESGMTIYTANGTATPYAYGEVKNIKFTDGTTGIGTVKVDGNDMKAYYRNGLLGVDGWTAGNKARAAVYNISGMAVLSIDNWDGSPIPTDGLADGIYIFNVDNNTIKFTKQ